MKPGFSNISSSDERKRLHLLISQIMVDGDEVSSRAVEEKGWVSVLIAGYFSMKDELIQNLSQDLKSSGEETIFGCSVEGINNSPGLKEDRIFFKCEVNASDIADMSEELMTMDSMYFTDLSDFFIYSNHEDFIILGGSKRRIERILGESIDIANARFISHSENSILKSLYSELIKLYIKI